MNSTKGYFLFVEGGRIDHGHHDQQAHKAIEEFVEFDNTIEEALKRVDLSETLIIVTADHSHAMSFIGYDARNTSVFDNVQIPQFQSSKGNFTKIQYAMGTKTRNKDRYNQADSKTNDENYVFSSAVLKKSSNHGGEDVPIYASGPMVITNLPILS